MAINDLRLFALFEDEPFYIHLSAGSLRSPAVTNIRRLRRRLRKSFNLKVIFSQYGLLTHPPPIVATRGSGRIAALEYSLGAYGIP